MNLGNFALGSTVDFTFVTTAADTGAPTTLSGTPVISAYIDNSTTQITAGITLTADFDTVTGLNHVRAVLSAGNGYSTDQSVSFVITTGTVGGTSAVGYVVARCQIGNVPANVLQVNTEDTGVILGTAQTGTLSTTQATTDLTGYANDQLIGRSLIWLSGNAEGEGTDITDYASTNGLLTFTALTTAPANGDRFKIV